MYLEIHTYILIIKPPFFIVDKRHTTSFLAFANNAPTFFSINLSIRANICWGFTIYLKMSHLLGGLKTSPNFLSQFLCNEKNINWVQNADILTCFLLSTGTTTMAARCSSRGRTPGSPACPSSCCPSRGRGGPSVSSGVWGSGSCTQHSVICSVESLEIQIVKYGHFQFYQEQELSNSVDTPSFVSTFNGILSEARSQEKRPFSFSRYCLTHLANSSWYQIILASSVHSSNPQSIIWYVNVSTSRCCTHHTVKRCKM